MIRKLISKIFSKIDWQREFSICFNYAKRLEEENEKLKSLANRLLELTDGIRKDNGEVQKP